MKSGKQIFNEYMEATLVHPEKLPKPSQHCIDWFLAGYAWAKYEDKCAEEARRRGPDPGSLTNKVLLDILTELKEIRKRLRRGGGDK